MYHFLVSLQFMKEATQLESSLSSEERNLLSVAYKNVEVTYADCFQRRVAER